MKRKLPSGVNADVDTPTCKRLRSILKSEESPRSPNRSVCFRPPEDVGETLAKLKDGKLEESHLEALFADLEASKGSALVIWLQGLTEHVSKLDSDLQSVVERILLLPWTNHSQEIVSTYQRFLISLLSAHPAYTRAVVRSLLKKFTPSEAEEEVEEQPAVQEGSSASKTIQKGTKDEQHAIQEGSAHTSQTIHSVIKDIFTLSEDAKSQFITELDQTFPYFKRPTAKLVSFTRSATAVCQYIGEENRAAVLAIILEKIIRLDASLPRQDVYRLVEEERGAEEPGIDPIIARLVASLDSSMEILFELVDEEVVRQENLDPLKAERFTKILLRLFESHILPTHNVSHIQYLIFYLTGLRKGIRKKFLKRVWSIFISFNTASILRQAAITYLAGYLCRALSITTKILVKFLKRIIAWIHKYIGQDRTLAVDYMHVNLAAHGPFYSACQAAFYIVAFRHAELASGDDLAFLRSLQLNAIVSHPLNPLRVMQSGVVKEFSKIVSHYQLAYCKTILERNRRITLPVLGLSSNSTSALAKPLLLDNFFPFDPYRLPRSKHWVERLYRRHEPIVDMDSDDSSEEEEEADAEEEEEDQQETVAASEEESPSLDHILVKGRSRTVSVSSNMSAGSSSQQKRTRKLSVTDVLLREISSL